MGWLTSWNSLQQQEIIAELGSALDLSDTTTLSTVLRGVLLVMVVVLVTGGVGAVFAARGDRSSRVMISIVGVIVAMLFIFSGSLIGVIPGAFALWSVVQLWGKESTRWFAQRNGQPVPPRAQLKPANAQPQAPAPGTFQHGPVQGGPVQGGPVQGGPVQQGPVPPQHAQPGQPYPAGAAHYPPMPVAGRRPSSVTTALLATALSSAAAFGCSAFYLLLYLAVPRQELLDAQMESPFIESMNVTEAEMSQALTTTAVLCCIAVVLSAAALIAAWVMHRGRRIGHTALFVLSGVTVLFGVFSVVGVPWAALAVWVIVLLRRRTTLDWLAQQR